MKIFSSLKSNKSRNNFDKIFRKRKKRKVKLIHLSLKDIGVKSKKIKTKYGIIELINSDIFNKKAAPAKAKTAKKPNR